VPLGSQKPCGEEKRVARQEESEEKSGFGEYDEDDADEPSGLYEEFWF
jgi:hypothetical protein